MNPQPVVLLLAAGSSRRFGADKRRASPADAPSLLELSIKCYGASGLPIYVCLSARREDDDIEPLVHAFGARCIRCSSAHEGMGSTIAEAVRSFQQGVQQLRGSGAAAMQPAMFIALADMPAVRADTLQKLAAAARTDRIVFPVYQSQRGHPVVFGADFLPLLEELSGDTGASSVLREHAAACRPIAVDDPGVAQDADTPAALEALSVLLRARSSDAASR